MYLATEGVGGLTAAITARLRRNSAARKRQAARG